ncbi:hypothetical protein OK016_16405 [Vibrio chagasii]|nr:hypothetical protein [Vibrio chagasii]
MGFCEEAVHTPRKTLNSKTLLQEAKCMLLKMNYKFWSLQKELQANIGVIMLLQSDSGPIPWEQAG